MSRTMAQDPLQKYNFRVSIPGIPTTIGFQKVSGLTRELGVTEYREGGYGYTHKLTGQEKCNPITLERGMFADTALEDLWKKSATQNDYRCTITIEELTKTKEVARVWNLAEAWVSKWESSDYDGESDDVAIEKLEIQFEYYLD